MRHPRLAYLGWSVLTVLAGVGSRVFRTGLPAIDKYLGDALYAILIYLALSVIQPGAAPMRRALLAFALAAAIEAFQATGIPAGLASSGSLAFRAAAVVLGTRFSWYDMGAYAAGILGAWALDAVLARSARAPNAPGPLKF